MRSRRAAFLRRHFRNGRICLHTRDEGKYDDEFCLCVRLDMGEYVRRSSHFPKRPSTSDRATVTGDRVATAYLPRAALKLTLLTIRLEDDESQHT